MNKLGELKQGQVFGELTILEFDHQDGKEYYYKCQCSCGKICIKSARSLLYANTRLKSTGALRGIQAYFIGATWNPITTTAGNGTSTSAQALPSTATLGTVGTVGMNLAREAESYTNSDGNTRYHSKLGLGSCTTDCYVRWNLVKVAPSWKDFR